MAIDAEDVELIHKIQFIDEREKSLFATGQLGIQVENFLRSPVGRYLHARAIQEVRECETAALDCNPFSLLGRRKLKRLQLRAGPARNFMKWCADAIVEGRHAEKEIEGDNY